MDDVNINEICLHLEEVEVESADGDEWIKLNWINKQSGDNETSQSSDARKEDSSTETLQTKDNDNKVSSNAEAEDISDGISVITESDTDTVSNNLQLCRYNNITYGPLWMLETQINKQGNIRNILIACVTGIIIGFILSHFFITPEANPNSNGINTESLKTVSHNIVNTCKALTEVKAMLNEIKARTAVDKKIMEHFIGQLSKIDSANKISDKPTARSESFNFDQYSLDQVSQLQMSLHVLSSLALIYDNNSSLNEISKTLDIVNSTKSFYENLILFNNNTQNEYNSLALKILQHDSDKIYITSKSLLSNLMEKMSKVTFNVYNKYTKQKYKLIKKLCDLKNVLPDDEFLKRITENNEIFKNYDKSCFSRYSSKKFDRKTNEKGKAKVKNVRERSRKANNTTVHARYNKENGQKKIYDDNGKSSSKKESTKRLNEHNYTIPKFFQNGSDKIHNTSQLLFSDSMGKINKETLNKHMCTKCNEATQMNEVSKDNFDDILIPLWKDTSPLSTNYCSRSNIEDVSTSNCKTENCIVNSNNKHDANKESASDYKSSTKVSFEKNKSKQKDHSKLSDSTKKVFNNDDKKIKQKKMPSQNEMKNRMLENNNYRTPKRSSFNSHVRKQDDYINVDWQSNNERFDIRKKKREDDISDWYFKRAYSRRNARRHAEDLYERNNKQFWKKRR